MTADRDTGLRVTLPLVWRGDVLMLGEQGEVGDIHQWEDGTWAAWRRSKMDGPRGLFADCIPTRAAAERAVEQAVMEKMGGVG